MKGTRVSVVLKSPVGDELEQSINLSFLASIDEVEYEAILIGLRMARQLQVRKVNVCSDSQLVVNQVE